MRLLYSGKVRDLYADGDDLIMVASDRISVYDAVLPTPIPDKGAILTQLSLWWFERLADLVPNHVISATRVPAEWAGRAIRCRRLDMIGVECIARGYLAGLGLASYRASGSVSGQDLIDQLLFLRSMNRRVDHASLRLVAQLDSDGEFTNRLGMQHVTIINQADDLTRAQIRIAD